MLECTVKDCPICKLDRQMEANYDQIRTLALNMQRTAQEDADMQQLIDSNEFLFKQMEELGRG